MRLVDFIMNRNDKMKIKRSSIKEDEYEVLFANQIVFIGSMTLCRSYIKMHDKVQP